MLENLGDAGAGKRHDALVGFAHRRHVERQEQLPVTEQFRSRLAGQWRAEPGHAADVQLLVTVDDQQGNRSVAAQLDSQAPRLFQLAAEQQGGRRQFTEEAGNGRRIAASIEHVPPHRPQANKRTADVEIVEEKAPQAITDHELSTSATWTSRKTALLPDTGGSSSTWDRSATP